MEALGSELAFKLPFFLLPFIKTSKPTAVSCLCTPRVPRTSLIFQGLETGPPGTADFGSCLLLGRDFMNPLVLVQMVYWIGICRNWRLSGVLELFLSSVCSVVGCTVFLGDTAAVRPVPSPPCFFLCMYWVKRFI